MRCAGAFRRENVGMSNRKTSESLVRRKPKVSSAMTIIGGLGVPKRNRAFGHGIAMVSRLIFRPHICIRRDDGEHNIRHLIGLVSFVCRMAVRKIRQQPQGAFGTDETSQDGSDGRGSLEKSLRLMHM